MNNRSLALPLFMFLVMLLVYPDVSDTKTFTKADEVIYTNGQTVEEGRNKTFSTFTFVPDSASYNYNISSIGYKALVSIYVKKGVTVLRVAKYYINESGIAAYLDYSYFSGVGTDVAITPAATADPKVYTFNITNASGEVVFVERQIIK